MGAGQRAPALEALGFPKCHGVVLQALPSYHQPIAARVFVRALQSKAAASPRCPKVRRGLGHRRLESGFRAGMDIDFGNFVDHVSYQ